MLSAIYIGFDPREAAAFAVARDSIQRHLTLPVPVYGVVLSELQKRGLYTRKMEKRIGQWTGADGRSWSSSEPVLWDEVSQWTMATEHAIARFLVPYLARLQSRTVFTPLSGKAKELPRSAGWVAFTDGDVLARSNLVRMMEGLDTSKALYCVQHDHVPSNDVKMDGQVQSAYSRKNWSSVFLVNCDHESNKALTPDIVNMLPGRDLHRFCWLKDEEIGALGPEWNYLVGHTDAAVDPKVVHFTDGVPDMKGYENCPFSDEWREARDQWALGALNLPG